MDTFRCLGLLTLIFLAKDQPNNGYHIIMRAYITGYPLGQLSEKKVQKFL